MNLTPLNIEQSLARYLADKFKAIGFNIKWFDTQQTESVGGSKTITMVKDFPNESTNIASHDGDSGASIINVPAFSIFCSSPETSDSERLGIGESIFEWQASVRIDGFADTELEWYQFAGYFSEWFGHPDIRVSLYDYDADLSSNSPTECDEKVRFFNTNISRTELNERPAVRFYLNISTTALFVE